MKLKNRETLSRPGRFGFAAYSPKCDLHSNRTYAECPINSKLYYRQLQIWDFYEQQSLRENYTTEWVWFRLNTRDGPFEGTELVQHGDDPVPVNLAAGEHTLHLVHREDGTYIDQFFATTDIEFDPNETDPQTAVEPQNKLTTTWGTLKSGF